MANAPAGYLMADGTAVGRETSPDWFDAIGMPFGSGEGEKTFNLPDLAGRFLQGSAIPGQTVQAGLPDITGNFRAKAAAGEIPAGAFHGIGNTGGGSRDDSAPTVEEIGLDASKPDPVYGISGTVQPAALTFLASGLLMRQAIRALSMWPGWPGMSGVCRRPSNKLDETENAIPFRYAGKTDRGDSG